MSVFSHMKTTDWIKNIACMYFFNLHVNDTWINKRKLQAQLLMKVIAFLRTYFFSSLSVFIQLHHNNFLYKQFSFIFFFSKLVSIWNNNFISRSTFISLISIQNNVLYLWGYNFLFGIKIWIQHSQQYQY